MRDEQIPGPFSTVDPAGGVVLPRGVGLVFCIGAQKAGTSWLYQMLREGGGCHFGGAKEKHYFDVRTGAEVSHLKNRIDLARQRADSLQAKDGPVNRAALFHLSSLVDLLGIYTGAQTGGHRHDPYLKYLLKGHEGQKWLCDFTPSYAVLPSEVFADMAGLGESRFIFVMRDPVARMWSQIRMWASVQPDAPPSGSPGLLRLCRTRLHELDQLGILPNLGRADYRRTITALEKAVPAERVHYAFYEDLFSQDGVDGICDFLGIDRCPADRGRRVNQGVAVPIPAEDEALLRRIFAPQYSFVRSRFGAAVPAAWLA